MGLSGQPSWHRAPGGVWRPIRWASARIVAGVGNRLIDLDALRRGWPSATRVIQAEQVHGSSLAVLGATERPEGMIAGCDGLLTEADGVALLVRTADCLPIFVAAPARPVVGIVHVGWRGLAAELPKRVIGLFWRAFRIAPSQLDVAIGPSIRACCYEVGPEVAARFQGFTSREGDRILCDLVAAAVAQLRQAGVRAGRMSDSGQCTCCPGDEWHSVRRDGPGAGRLHSFIMIRPGGRSRIPGGHAPPR